MLVLDNCVWPKYHVWSLFFDNIKYTLVKASVMTLPTLAFNKRTIMGTIDTLCTFVIQLDLRKKIIYIKIIMIRSNLYIIKYMT